MDMTTFFNGDELYGDSFTPEEVAEWHETEKQGYYNMVTRDENTHYRYAYHSLNKRYGFRFLPDISNLDILGIGSAYGDELLPVVDRAATITVLEPGEGFHNNSINGMPIHYVKPNPCGILPFSDERFDLITCFGVLHHIPNVSTVIEGISRCLRPGGHALFREPIVSMGDWRQPRPGLTKNERGIPLKIFRKIIAGAGLRIKQETKCMLPITRRIGRLLNKPVYNSIALVLMDKTLCSLPVWRYKYHPTTKIEKLQPGAVFYVVEKPA
jgi:SAM-dependent methyltransferase